VEIDRGAKRGIALQDGIFAWFGFVASAAFLTFLVLKTAVYIHESDPYPESYSVICILVVVLAAAPCSFCGVKGYALSRFYGLGDKMSMFCLVPVTALITCTLAAHLALALIADPSPALFSGLVWFGAIAFPGMFGYFYARPAPKVQTPVDDLLPKM